MTRPQITQVITVLRNVFNSSRMWMLLQVVDPLQELEDPPRQVTL